MTQVFDEGDARTEKYKVINVGVGGIVGQLHAA